MDQDRFKEKALGFEVRKPSSWHFLPTAWSPTALLKRAPAFKDTLLRYASLPFICAQGRHESRIHALPTFQVCARAAISYNPGLASTLLESMIAGMQRHYPNYAVIAASSRLELAGCKAIYMRGTFSVIVEIDGERVEMACLSRSYALFGPRAAITLGLSGSSDPAYFSEADFEQILGSIRMHG